MYLLSRWSCNGFHFTSKLWILASRDWASRSRKSRFYFISQNVLVHAHAVSVTQRPRHIPANNGRHSLQLKVSIRLPTFRWSCNLLRIFKGTNWAAVSAIIIYCFRARALQSKLLLTRMLNGRAEGTFMIPWAVPFIVMTYGQSSNFTDA